MERYTIADLNRDFPTDDACLEWLKNHLYPNGIYCIKCGQVTKHHKITKRRSYSCDVCGRHVHPTSGTIFEHSPTRLKLWFHAIYLMSSTRCGISAKQIERETGVTYKTAWRMFHQIRSLLQERYRTTSGEFEVDETYIGGRRAGKRGRGATGKTPVLGIVRRKGRISASVSKDVKYSTIMPVIRKRILPESIVYTDEFPIYNRLHKRGYKHKRINHGAKVWVSGDIHTNTIEGFWSLLKRSINGVYHSVSQKHLQNYINEYSFRYNHRGDDKPLFKTILERV